MAEQRRTDWTIPGSQGAPSLHLSLPHPMFIPTDRPDRTPKRVDKYQYAPPKPQPGTGAARINEGWVSFCPAPVSRYRYHVAIIFQAGSGVSIPQSHNIEGPDGRAQLCANNAPRLAIQQNGDDYGALGPLGVCA
ncbi:hypothetical protein B0T18DRAFT_222640 [Schizothecium vesticola]|uniref:Uncharacterized protein n=1 Tax=Schizothecium vesticola TaxID=314040 RepID=A0AA40EKH8_9PEZI|nr:hypothetical protein B0T18DRAFT_222640 [Schizothecium vesticola]